MKKKHGYTITTTSESTPFNSRNTCALMLVVFMLWNSAFAATRAPTEDSLWYYEIGGAEPVSVPANPSVVSVTLGGSAQLGLGYSCGKFNPVTAVTNTLNNIGAGVDNMMNAMSVAASAAIASLPALILQRANPGLYDMFQNALLKAEETMQLATQSCEQMEGPKLRRVRIPMLILLPCPRVMTGKFKWGLVVMMRSRQRVPSNHRTVTAVFPGWVARRGEPVSLCWSSPVTSSRQATTSI